MTSEDDVFVLSNKRPLIRTLELPTALLAPEAAAAIKNFFVARNARVEVTSATSLNVAEGSRFALRIWGVTKRGYRKLPLRAVVVAKPAVGQGSSGSIVGINVSSDEGWYAMGRGAIADRAYNQRFDVIERGLRTLVGDVDKSRK